MKRSWLCFSHCDSLCCLGFFETACVNDLLFNRLQRWGPVQRWKWVWLKRSCRGHNALRNGSSFSGYTQKFVAFQWIVVARVSPYRARTAHQRKQLSRVVTVILSTVVGFFSYVTVVTVVEELQPTSILKFHRWTVFWKPRYRCFYTGLIRCYVLNS